MEVLFKIGEIADMFEISIRALRLYDRLGLFKPEYIDKSTGYRYYTADQMQQLHVIIVLKSIGFKLSEIKMLFDHGTDSSELLDMLEHKQDEWENRIAIADFNIENIKIIKKSIEMEAGTHKKQHDEKERAHKLSQLVCLENLKIDSMLTEVLWL